MSTAPMMVPLRTVVVDRLVWIPVEYLGAERVAELELRLTKVPVRKSEFAAFDGKLEPVLMYERKGRWIGVPRAFYETELKDSLGLAEMLRYPEFKRCEYRLAGCSDEGPYAEQAKLATELASCFKAGRWGGILQATPGYGKTVVALRVIAQMNVPVLVLVNKDFLMTQWVARIRRFLPDARIGIVKQETNDWKGRDIVVASMSTLAVREFTPEFRDYFGMIVSDETHRISAKTWSALVQRFRAKWRLGLTATPRRKDEMQDVFFWHIGPVIAKAKIETALPKLRRVRTSFRLPYKEVLKLVQGDKPKQLMTPALLRHIVGDRARNELVVDEIFAAVTSKNQRKVIVLSSRKEDHLHIMRGLFEQKCRENGVNVTTGFYYGGLTQDELRLAESRQVIFSTFQMVGEALDIESLDTAIFATPESDVEQAAGRIRRFCIAEPAKCKKMCPWRAGACTAKPEPIVVDILDTLVRRCMMKAKWRFSFYRDSGMLDGMSDE